MKRLLIILIIILSYGTAWGATYNTTDCEHATVQTEINKATTDGDIVVIKAGTCTWDTKVTFSSANSVTIKGESKDTTIILHANGVTTAILELTTTAGKTVELSDLQIDATGNSSSTPAGSVSILGASKNVLIHDNIFKWGTAGGGRFIWGLGYNAGVIYNNTFTRTSAADNATTKQCIGFQSDSAAFDRDVLFGTAVEDEAWYIEGNTFTWDHSGDSCIDGYPGARYVIRYNTFSGKTGIGTHGLDSAARSVISVEAYKNSFTNAVMTTHRIYSSRGGTALVWGNEGSGTGTNISSLRSYRSCPNASGTITGMATGVMTDSGYDFTTIANIPVSGTNTVNDIYNVTKNDHSLITAHGTNTVTFTTPTDAAATWEVGDVWGITYYYNAYGLCLGGSSADGNTAGQEGWPCGDQVGWVGIPTDSKGQQSFPILYWTNYFNATEQKGTGTVTERGGYTDCARALTTHIVEGREYHVPTGIQTSSSSPFNGTSGIGYGTDANKPATCTVATYGSYYFSTDVGDHGTLYKCTTTNTWTSYYAPTACPHPHTGLTGSCAATPGTTGYNVNEGAPPTVALTVTAGAGNGIGTVTSSPTGISCTITEGVTSGTCEASFDTASDVNLTYTTADPACSLPTNTWSGDGTGTVYRLVTMSAAKAVTSTATKHACQTVGSGATHVWGSGSTITWQ